MPENQAVPKPSDKDFKPGDRRSFDYGDARFNKYVRISLGYWRAHTPADAALAEGSCDAIMVSQDTTVTGVPADGGASAALPYTTGKWHYAAYERVSAIGAGTIWLGWYRKPNPET
jgi:hypothetical protein